MRLVVIGGEAAGLSAASRARRLDPHREIVVLEKSGHISYSACGLPYFIGGRVRALEELRVHDAAFFARERRIEVRTGAEVEAISHARREVTLVGGERIRFDQLVIATGARRTHAVGENVFALDTWDGAERLRDFAAARKAGSAAVIGGGYIGLEACEALRSLGFAVRLHEAAGYLMGRECAWLTGRLHSHLERCGVEVRLNSRVTAPPPADLVIAAYGLRPNVALAAETGVELGRSGAIEVSDRMETNLEAVYAAGDCAETRQLVSGAPLWLPLGTTANKMGRVAGSSAAGGRDRFPGVVGTQAARVCGLNVAVTGLSDAAARTAGFDAVSTAIEAKDKAAYFRARPVAAQLTADRRSGRVLGAAVIGEDNAAARINAVAVALHQRADVEEFARMDLAYAPPMAPVWDPLLVAAHELMKLLH